MRCVECAGSVTVSHAPVSATTPPGEPSGATAAGRVGVASLDIQKPSPNLHQPTPWPTDGQAARWHSNPRQCVAGAPLGASRAGAFHRFLPCPTATAAPVLVSLTIEPDILVPFAHDWNITSGRSLLNPPCTNVHNLGDLRLVTLGLPNGLSDVFEFKVQIFGFGSVLSGACVTQVGLTAMSGALGVLIIVGATDPWWLNGTTSLFDISKGNGP